MSLRMRLILSFTFIVLLCLSISAVAVTVVLQSSRDRLAMSSLADTARPIYVQVQAVARGEATWLELLQNLNEQARENEVYIILADSGGKILSQASPVAGAPKLNAVIPVEDKTADTPATPLTVTNASALASQGTFETAGGQTFIYSAYDVSRIFDYLRASRFDTLVLAVPRSESLAILAGLVSPFLQAGLVALVISIIVAILLARSAYKPVSRVTEAVEKVAQGDYDHEIPVEGPKELRNLAVRFNEMTSRVRESQQQLRHFVADVSHQLRTPLTSIRGFAQAMLDGTADDEESRQKAARVIDDESKRMIRQVEELLELSRMQSGQLEMKRELVDVKELLQHCREVFSLRAEEGKVQLRADIEPLVPVTGDEDRLEQVFTNLLDNALKNTPVGGEVTVSARNIPGNLVEVVVSDTGPGIPPEQLPWVFERFYRASGLRAGFGLGLAIAREIVTRHEGTIGVRSEPGEGTQFTIVLPSGTSAARE